MLIQIHMIQNHSPSNLNRDDLGAPKTCFFGGVLRSRISSQCIKRSIRLSSEFQALLGGVRTRQLARLIAKEVGNGNDVESQAAEILDMIGFKPKRARKGDAQGDAGDSEDRSKMLVYTTRGAVEEMAALLRNGGKTKSQDQLAVAFADLIASRTVVPDMALSGRMLEPDKEAAALWKKLDTTVNAALQVAHAISTHEARPEVDYYVAADDVPGDNAGAGYVDEAMFSSACFYKYFSISWETLLKNLQGEIDLAAHTVGAFIRGAALANPTGKQNSFAAHNPPDGMLVELRGTPISYANAFARPVVQGERDVVSQSVAQLAQYACDLDAGYGRPRDRFWFSPNLRFPLSIVEGKETIPLTGNSFKSLDAIIPAVLTAMGCDWEQARKVAVR